MMKNVPYRETTQNTFSYFRIFFSFAKRSKLGETVTCFVQFRISRNKKNTELSNLTEGDWEAPEQNNLFN